MRQVQIFLLCTLSACGTDYRPDDLNNSSDPGVDGGVKTDGGSSTTAEDARVPPPDGIPAGLAPCDEAPYHSDFAFIEDKVLAPNCLDGCHSGSDPGADMDLSVGAAYANLVNVPSHQSGWMRVVPNDASASALMVQVGAETGFAIEGTMPWNQPKLCEPILDAMRRWIVAGAPPR